MTKWWFSDDPKITKERDAYCKKQDEIKKAKIGEGYILESNGIYYKKEDIEDGRCPLNGTLVHMGFKSLPNGKWKYTGRTDNS